MIKPGEYKIITNIIDECISSTKKSADHILEIIDTLSQTDTSKQSQSYFGVRSASSATLGLILEDITTYPTSLRSYVIAIHKYIYKKYNVKDIDKFLEEHFLEVEQNFADIANKLKFNITRIGTASGRWEDVDTPINNINKGEYSNIELTWDLIGGSNSCG
ncbi:hypothetical protein CMI45_01180 [Candidatus Pacearchaeota archaeon]|nr:hypothetical protein [Candidatus Pacearchaeota archaeon]|tara:strand:+ start:6012 stop:6494 length:483 start_codon:yes stop_codon:yes gene_type:complete